MCCGFLCHVCGLNSPVHVCGLISPVHGLVWSVQFMAVVWSVQFMSVVWSVQFMAWSDQSSSCLWSDQSSSCLWSDQSSSCLLWFLICWLVQVLFLSLVNLYFSHSHFPVTNGLDLFSGACLNKLLFLWCQIEQSRWFARLNASLPINGKRAGFQKAVIL